MTTGRGRCSGVLLPRKFQWHDTDNRTLMGVPGPVSAPWHLRELGACALARIDTCGRTVQWLDPITQATHGNPTKLPDDGDWPLTPAVQFFGQDTEVEIWNVSAWEQDRSVAGKRRRERELASTVSPHTSAPTTSPARVHVVDEAEGAAAAAFPPDMDTDAAPPSHAEADPAPPRLHGADAGQPPRHPEQPRAAADVPGCMPQERFDDLREQVHRLGDLADVALEESVVVPDSAGAEAEPDAQTLTLSLSNVTVQPPVTAEDASEDSRAEADEGHDPLFPPAPSSSLEYYDADPPPPLATEQPPPMEIASPRTRRANQRERNLQFDLAEADKTVVRQRDELQKLRVERDRRRDELNRAQRSLTNAQEHSAQLQRRLTDSENRVVDLRRAKQEVEWSMTQMAEKLREREANEVAAAGSLREMESRVVDLERELNTDREVMQEQRRELVRAGSSRAVLDELNEKLSAAVSRAQEAEGKEVHLVSQLSQANLAKERADQRKLESMSRQAAAEAEVHEQRALVAQLQGRLSEEKSRWKAQVEELQDDVQQLHREKAELEMAAETAQAQAGDAMAASSLSRQQSSDDATKLSEALSRVHVSESKLSCAEARAEEMARRETALLAQVAELEESVHTLRATSNSAAADAAAGAAAARENTALRRKLERSRDREAALEKELADARAEAAAAAAHATAQQEKAAARWKREACLHEHNMGLRNAQVARLQKACSTRDEWVQELEEQLLNARTREALFMGDGSDLSNVGLAVESENSSTADPSTSPVPAQRQLQVSSVAPPRPKVTPRSSPAPDTASAPRSPPALSTGEPELAGLADWRARMDEGMAREHALEVKVQALEVKVQALERKVEEQKQQVAEAQESMQEAEDYAEELTLRREGYIAEAKRLREEIESLKQQLGRNDGSQSAIESQCADMVSAAGAPDVGSADGNSGVFTPRNPSPLVDGEPVMVVRADLAAVSSSSTAPSAPELQRERDDLRATVQRQEEQLLQLRERREQAIQHGLEVLRQAEQEHRQRVDADATKLAEKKVEQAAEEKRKAEEERDEMKRKLQAAEARVEAFTEPYARQSPFPLPVPLGRGSPRASGLRSPKQGGLRRTTNSAPLLQPHSQVSDPSTPASPAPVPRRQSAPSPDISVDAAE